MGGEVTETSGDAEQERIEFGELSNREEVVGGLRVLGVHHLEDGIWEGLWDPVPCISNAVRRYMRVDGVLTGRS